jgi:pilus biogenesis lipoprotein CpaD
MRYFFVVFAVASVLLAGCDVTVPSQVRTGDIRLSEQVKTQTMSVHHVDHERIGMIADDYAHKGRGDMALVVSYLKGHPRNEIEAETRGRALRKAFADAGVKQLRVDYAPVTDEAYAGQAVVSYTALTALPPADCGSITGHNGADTLERMEKYQLGCTNKEYLSKMIVNPEDLLGRSGVPDGDSRRQGTVVEKYKSGTPNEKLDGMNASTVGSE